MKKKLIILANGRSLLAYRHLTDDLATPPSRLEQIEVNFQPGQPDPSDATDDDGRFPGGSIAGQGVAMKHGEPHGREIEKKKRLVRGIAQSINEILELEECENWNLAVPASMSHQLVDQLPETMQHKLTQLKLGDYTKLPANKIEPLFS